MNGMLQLQTSSRRICPKRNSREKKKIARTLLPYVEARTREQLRKAELFFDQLKEQGLTGSEKPLKVGHIRMENESGKWKKYYFRLQKKCLEYRSKDKTKAKGLIYLDCVKIIPRKWSRPGPNQPVNAASEPYDISVPLVETQQTAGQKPLVYYGFYIQTLYLTYKIRAKHEAATRQWIEAIELASIDKITTKEFQDNLRKAAIMDEPKPADEADLPHYDKPYLETTIKGKPKVFKIKTSLTFGRSSTTDVVLDDRKISRQHARIDFNGSYCTFTDLGSSHGSKINGLPATSNILRHNDELQLGETKMYFRAT
eukprot:TRINITY_DN5346_c0_g1_i1.p1 TRINITY_DN5346_c0_g1~~TRINITY_DN5346_c0_g1_i1.p1  ORF type:complete len:313 (+),score=74.91 TRINITY_DN5346_c0_g1_i1:492-1430(+)